MCSMMTPASRLRRTPSDGAVVFDVRRERLREGRVLDDDMPVAVEGSGLLGGVGIVGAELAGSGLVGIVPVAAREPEGFLIAHRDLDVVRVREDRHGGKGVGSLQRPGEAQVGVPPLRRTRRG